MNNDVEEARSYHEKFRKALVKASVHDTFREALLEFEEIDRYEFVPDIEEISACICTHPINHLFFVKSNVTGKELVIGSSCINQFLPERQQKIAHEFLLAAKRKTKSCKKCKKRMRKVGNEDNDYCEICRNLFSTCLDCNQTIYKTSFGKTMYRCRDCFQEIKKRKFPYKPSFLKRDGYDSE